MSNQSREELRESIHIGALAIKKIEKAEYSLRQAASWGVTDLAGGRTLSSLKKHACMKEASQRMNEAGCLIRKFDERLSKVTVPVSAAIRIDEVAKFADCFFDGFLIDLMVQQKIDRALRNAAGAKAKVRGAVRQLERLFEMESRQIEALNKQITSLIIHAEL